MGSSRTTIGTLEVDRLQNVIAKMPVAGQLSLELQANPKRSGRHLNLHKDDIEETAVPLDYRD